MDRAFDKPSVVETQLSLGNGRCLDVMRHHQQCCVQLGLQSLQQIENLRTGHAVDVEGEVGLLEHVDVAADCPGMGLRPLTAALKPTGGEKVAGRSYFRERFSKALNVSPPAPFLLSNLSRLAR